MKISSQQSGELLGIFDRVFVALFVTFHDELVVRKRDSASRCELTNESSLGEMRPWGGLLIAISCIKIRKLSWS